MFERLRKLGAEFDRMRGEIARAFADATEHDVQALTDEAVKTARTHRGAKDSAVLAPLVAAKADLLVTGDDDLLALRSRHPIETPTEFGSRL